jgi:putative oxidoreductase
MKSLPNLGLLVLRCTFSFMLFINHGLEKFLNFSSLSKSFPNPIGVGSAWSAGLVVFAEVFMSVLIFVGLFTRIACIPVIISMGVAAFIVHTHDTLAHKELALLYFAAFVAIATLGPGSYSLDTKFRRVS